MLSGQHCNISCCSSSVVYESLSSQIFSVCRSFNIVCCPFTVVCRTLSHRDVYKQISSFASNVLIDHRSDSNKMNNSPKTNSSSNMHRHSLLPTFSQTSNTIEFTLLLSNVPGKCLIWILLLFLFFHHIISRTSVEC